VYVASSWRNRIQPSVVSALRGAGHDVYDFRHPRPGDDGFHWSAIDPAWQDWTPERFRAALEHPIAQSGFGSDMDALRACDACVLVLPCGRSAHLELGWAAGAGKRTLVLFTQRDEPELMYRMLDGICVSVEEVIARLGVPRASSPGTEP
jgi:hypothetical protein